jgi:hypothetical protein
MDHVLCDGVTLDLPWSNCHEGRLGRFLETPPANWSSEFRVWQGYFHGGGLEIP